MKPLNEMKTNLERKQEEYFVKDLSGRGYTATVPYKQLIENWAVEQVSNDDEELTLMDWLHDSQIGDEFVTETNEIITRIK